MLTAKQLKAIELLIGGKLSVREIAEQIGVSASTVMRWKHADEFNAAYTAQIKEVMNEAAARAFRTVTDIMQNSDSDSSRLSAAKDLLDRAGFKAKDLNAQGADMNLNIVVSYEGGRRVDGDQNRKQ